ncbi:TPA: hypothetical protein ACGXMV_004142 [Bacillus pacificus]
MKHPNQLKCINLQEMTSSDESSVEFSFWRESVVVNPELDNSSFVQLDYDSVKKLHKKLGKWLKRYEFHNEVGE